MSSFKPLDSKREEFRKYLEKTGVMDALTKALVALYEEPEKPEDALAYMQARLGAGNPENSELVKELQQEIADLKIDLASVGMETVKERVNKPGNLGNAEVGGKDKEAQNTVDAGKSADVKTVDCLDKGDCIENADCVLKGEGLGTGEPLATIAAEKMAGPSADTEKSTQVDAPPPEEEGKE